MPLVLPGTNLGMAGKSVEDYAKDYTEPELRKKLKDEIQAGDRGGRTGQWSARKAQLLTQAYEAKGGGYQHKGRRSASQKHLKDWGDQDWKTSSGKAGARHGEDEERYLPDVAWKLLSDKERKATGAKKRGAATQHVQNTDAAKEARAAAELLTLKAGEAVTRVKKMSTASALDRAAKAEDKHGKSRRSVLEAIEKRRKKLG